MGAWWNSAESVGRINTIVLACAAGFGFITAFFVAASWFTGTRLADLQDSELNRYKKEADIRIANANESSSRANKQAAEANRQAAEANEHAASLQVQAMQLRQQLLWQGPRSNLLVGENRNRFVAALKPFSAQKIDVRHSAATIMVNNKIVMSTPIGDDSLALAKVLIGTLHDAGWVLPLSPLVSRFQGDGVEVQILSKASSKTKSAADALVAALGRAQIGCKGPVSISPENAARVGSDVIDPPVEDDTIILLVLTHP